MMKHTFRLVVGLLVSVLVTHCVAYASEVFGPVSVSSPQGDFGGAFPLINIINRSGLSPFYTPGVTDFASYTATATHEQLNNSGFTNVSDDGPQQFTFDLGSLVEIRSVAIWSHEGSAPTAFELFADNDADFGNGTTVTLLGETSLAVLLDPQPAQVFNFPPTVTRFVHLNATASESPPDFYGLGEVAFEVVPEPSTCALAVLDEFAGRRLAGRHVERGNACRQTVASRQMPSRALTLPRQGTSGGSPVLAVSTDTDSRN